MILRVVIIEDEEIIRRGLVSTLDWPGMKCCVAGSAADGQSGLQLILEQKPDVVITDIRMPGMDGLEMIRQAQQQNSFHSILLTSYAEFEYARTAVNLHMDGYLLKPVDEEQLAQMMGKIYQQRRRELQIAQMEEISSFDLEMPGNSGDELVEKVLERIAQSSEQRLSIEALADEFYVSPSYLSRRFKAATGQTFLDVLNRHRIHQAVAMLNEGNYPISEIAMRTGFGDYKHFCSVFKRHTGITPSEYRNGRGC